MRRTGVALTLLAMLLVPAGAQARDRDHDKLPDRWEKKFNLSAKKKGTRKDADRDGLNNLGELRSGTSPRDKDSDNDGVRDDDEDRDRDRVDNANEIREGTSPRDKDSDDDGRGDAREDRDRDGLKNGGEDLTGNDPVDPDTDDDGDRDGAEQAGVVTSFEGGKLTIDLANGDSVAGKVTDDTAIECETEDAEESDHRRRRHGRAKTSSGGRLPEESSGDEGPLDEEPFEDGPLDDEFEDFPFEDDGEDSEDAGDEGDWEEAEDAGEDDYEDEDEYAGDEGKEEHDGRECSPKDLTAGTRVHEAEAKVTAKGLVFTEIELLK